MTVAAIRYGEIGWPVIPLHWVNEKGTCSCHRHGDCDKPAKHPLIRKWPDKATIDQDVIRTWWEQWPKANIGLATGHAFDVLDIDGREGMHALATLAKGRPFPGAPISITKRGFHLLYQPTGFNRTNILPKVDWKGIGGFIVAPPSVHQSGHVYRWGDHNGPSTSIENAPTFITKLLCPPAKPSPFDNECVPNRSVLGAVDVNGLYEVVRRNTPGTHNRNASLYWAARCVGELFVQDRITNRDVFEVNETLVSIAMGNGQSEKESRATIASGFKKGSGRS